MARISVSILSHGDSNPTLECVNSLLAEGAHANGRYELAVWVADNGSAGPDRERLQEGLAGLAEVTLRVYNRNLGFAAGHNRNVESILADSRPDFIWLLNNDCTIQPGCIDMLLGCSEAHPEVGIWGVTLLEKDGRTIQCAGSCIYYPWLSAYRQYGRGKSVSKLAYLVDSEPSYVSGASLFFPIETIENGLLPPAKLAPWGAGDAHELLNETFFLYFEELDLAKRLKPGLKSGWCRNARIVHRGGHTTGGGGSRRSAQAEYHSSLSALKFTRLYYPRRIWFMAPARFLAKNLQLLFTGNLGLMRSVIAAYRDYRHWVKGADN